jgi:hypothetical protein
VTESQDQGQGSGQGYPGRLIPDVKDIKAKAIFEQAMSIEVANFDPYASKAAFETFIQK